MSRPIITEFLGEGIELEEAHEIYKRNPELWSYIQAQDKHIDDIEKELQAERIKALSQAEQADEVRGKSKWISVEDRLPKVEIDGSKVLLYRVLNEGQVSMSISIHDTIMTKHCNSSETWWQPLPDKPNI